MKKSYLCIHAHFYQPPRENPWIEEIETQDHVGGNYHDWNERISSECYRPNAMARILDNRQQIENIVNNFEYLSFNVGPTLLSWLEKHDPRTYVRIIEADKNSIKAHNGHGNAIAQVYNHIIMPLATREDKVTQVRWGIADFKKRFGRNPESMWLAETACNEETLEVLVEEGLKFVILAPTQAEKMKRISDNNWIDVSSGNIDPARAYRCFLSDGSGRSIDVFFYDGPLSKAVAFDDLVNDAKIYANRLDQAKSQDGRSVELINIATDGETYGHHKAYGDRALAYLLKAEVGKHGFVMTNYAEFLSNFPPEFEVKIKAGENNLGTSWSCPHGVKRWADHCGCRGGGPGHWRQDWRKPLRETLDWLRTELAIIFVKEGEKYLKDVWEARNDYIDVILDRGDEIRYKFFQKHAKHRLSKEEVVACHNLLEMQRNTMLMYTSCGWFFTELSGEETVQIIKYATRAVQLAAVVSGIDLTAQFVKTLKKAKSNMEYYQDGEGIYEHLIKPSVVTLEKVASHFAISSLFRNYKERFHIYCYEFDTLDYKKETVVDDLTLCFGHVRIKSRITLEEIDAVFVLLQSELYDFYCYVKPFSEIKDYHNLGRKLFDDFTHGRINEMGNIIYEHFGREYFSLAGLFKEEKRNILKLLSTDGVERLKEVYDEIYQKHRRMINVYRLSRIPLPEEYRFAVEHKLSDDFNGLVSKDILSQSDVFDEAHQILVVANESGLKLNKAPAEHRLTRDLEKNIITLFAQWNDDMAKQCCQIVRIAHRLEIEMDLRTAQDYYLAIVNRLETDKAYLGSAGAQSLLDFLDLGHQLAINVDKFKANLQRLISLPAMAASKIQKMSKIFL